MGYPVTLNGRTYTLADFEGNNYVDGLPDAFEDFVTHAGDVYNDTSTTSNSIGTGSKTFTVTAGKPYQAGTPLRIADAAAPATNFLDAVVTSYSGTTLVVEAIGYGGSGTLTSWTVNIGGAKTIDGTLGVSQGGTGATTAAAARTNLDTYSKTEADSRFLNVSGEASDVTMTGNVTIGDAVGDTLTVNATADFNTGINVDGAITADGLTVDGTATITTADNTTQLSLISTDADGNVGPVLDLYRNSGSPVDNDLNGRILFSGENDNDEKVEYSRISAYVGDASDGTEDGNLYIQRLVAGTQNSVLSFLNTETVVNDSGLDLDFRVESDAQSIAFQVDASTGEINTNTYGFNIYNYDDGPNLNVSSGRDYNSLMMGAAANYGSNNSVENKWSWNWRGRGAASTTHYNFFYDEIGNQEYFRVQADASQKAFVVNEGSHDIDFRAESNGNTHALFVDAGNDGVGIFNSADTSLANLAVGLTGVAIAGDTDGATIGKGGIVRLVNGNNFSTTDATVMLLSGGSGGGVGQISSGFGFARHSNATWGTQIKMYVHPNDTADIDELHEAARVGPEEFVINETSNNYDFRVESDNQANALVVDAANDTVEIRNQVFGTGATVGGGHMVHFNTNQTTVSANNSATVNLFTRSPNAEVSATGTVYISAENSGGSVQVGCIIDFFFSNGTLNTTARETGSSQGTITFSVQENGAAISVTVAYTSGLGGAIRFNAGGIASLCSY